MVKLRPADMTDWARLYAWRNDPVTRAMFREQEPVPLQAHMAWLAGALKDERVLLLIGRDTAVSADVGTVRLDLPARGKKGARAEVSVTVEPRWRGRGYALALLQALRDSDGVRLAAQGAGAAFLVANVRVANYASLRAFAEAGYTPVRYAEEFVTLERTL